MRNIWLALAVGGLTACGTSAVNFEHQSELEVNTRGVALSADGFDGVVGMFGTTCRVAVSDASVGEDYNFPTEEETVNDNSTMFGETAVLVVSDMGAHVTYPDRVWDWSTSDFGTPGVVDGRIYAEGVSLLTDTNEDGCEVQWNTGSDVSSVSLSSGMCVGAGFAVDRTDGTTFVANGSDIISATPDGVEAIGSDADIVVWDVDAQVLYAAQTGTSMLYGLEADGEVRWSTDLAADIVSLDAMGPLAQAAVMVSNANGTGSLLTVDGYTGEITSSLATPEAADHVETSDNGRTMALILEREVHFFNVKALDF